MNEKVDKGPSRRLCLTQIVGDSQGGPLQQALPDRRARGSIRRIDRNTGTRGTLHGTDRHGRTGRRTFPVGAFHSGRLRRQDRHARPARRLGLVLGDDDRQDDGLRPVAARLQPLRGQVSGRASRSKNCTARWRTARRPAWARCSWRRCANGRNRSNAAHAPRSACNAHRPGDGRDAGAGDGDGGKPARLSSPSVGSSAPFIGLFGTVVGIMTSFQAIAGSKSTNLAVVAPGIAEALLATAIGLVAAIPAVIAYNKFSADAGKLAGADGGLRRRVFRHPVAPDRRAGECRRPPAGGPVR